MVYTAEESAFLARAVMQAGAAGYVAKTSPTAELIDALDGVAKGQTYTDSHIDLDSVSKHAWSTLTDSERAVLVAFCRGSKAHDIVESTGRSYSTVTTHKYNGLNKLGLRDGNDLLPYIYENGLLHELDD
ncbi:LuxR C-terminal-related transcriptional regulator [Xanthomonas campestris pv. convolvuli]|nr:LuxR C-terminal-related transcriptional regulator [Xanthomonas campestris pv. convolvuli]